MSKKNTVQLSAVILTKNSQQTIETAINSVLFADEVIVIDDYSSDATTRIAKKIGARIYQNSLQNNFAVQRNYGLKRARGEWVLFLDSDEWVSPELQQEIKQVTATSSVNGCLIKRSDYFLGRRLRGGENAHNRFLRLARRDMGRWQRPVHEVWQVKSPVGTLEHPLYHQLPSVSQFVDKLDHYTELETQLRLETGAGFRCWHLILPPLKFVNNYLWRGGFRDGMPGLIMAWMMSLHSLLVRIKLYEKS